MRNAFVTLAGLGALVTGVAHATVMLPLSVEEMAVESAAVVRGRVLSKAAEWGPAKKKIYTRTVLEVIEPIHRATDIPTRVEILTLGGELGELGMKVAGTPQFELDEDVIVFLRRDRKLPETFRVIGMGQGKFQVRREAKGRLVAFAGLDGIAFATKGSDGVLRADAQHPRDHRIGLDELKARIDRAVGKVPSPAGVAPKLDAAPPSGPAADTE